MSLKKTKTGWSCAVYSIQSAKDWAYRFWRTYPRASDVVLDLGGKTVNSSVQLAKYSQRGWELWKMLIKGVDKIVNDQSYANNPKIDALCQGTVLNTTIHLYSKMVVDAIKNKKMLYPDEASYLTAWWMPFIISCGLRDTL